MKYLWIAGLICLFFQCKRGAVLLENIPSCIESKIREIQKHPLQNPPASVWQYAYQGKVVYTISADCCDQYTLVYDSDCNIICSPGGGITGKGDGRCPDFSERASNAELIWQDKRQP